MSIPVLSWSEIPQADYDAAFLLFSQLVGEANPDLDRRRGAIHDNVLTLHGVLAAALRIERERMLRANSLLAVSTDPSLADETTLDRLFSNYRVARLTGQQASGSLTLVLTRPLPTIIPAGFEFSIGPRRFATTQSYAARLASADLLSDTDRLLVTQTNGTYSFTIEVVAVVPGAAGLLRKGDALLPSKPIPHLSRTYATDDFVDGRDVESNATMFARLELGVAARGWSHQTGVVALVHEYPPFASAAVSVVGGGYAEMLRDKHSIFPISRGNRVDLWIKPHSPPAVQTIVKTATYTGDVAAGPLWSVSLDRDDLPGLYAVTDVLRDGRSSVDTVAPTQFIRGYTAADGDPDIVGALEAGFSRYQTGVLTFVDPADAGETLVANVTTADYAITAVRMEDVEGLQAFLDAADKRPLAGDVVVRGAVPCFVSVELELLADASLSLDEASLASATAAVVNQAGFAGAVYASQIATAVTPLLPAGAALLRTRLSGIVFRPDGTRSLFRDREVLSAPDEPAKMTTANTVAFFLDPSDVSVNVTSNG